jgi:hypothetical protein
MAESAQEPTNLPAREADLELRGSYLGVKFHPAIALAPKRGLEFSTLLSERVDVTKVDVGSGTWVFSHPLPETPKGQFQIAVTAQRIQISATFPATTTPPEWIETRQMEVLRRFESFFRPTLILSSAAMIRATLKIDGDARVFLANHVMHLDQSRLRLFNRPAHLVGMRLSFPPYKLKTDDAEKSEDWLLDVKAESLVEDPTKLYLEADGRWQARDGMKWDEQAATKVTERLVTVSDYVRKNVVGFVRGREGEKGGDLK